MAAASSRDSDGAIKTVKDGVMTVVGPIKLSQGGWGVIVDDPIFLHVEFGNETFGNPGPPNPHCGTPCEYNATTGTKFWGFAAALFSLDGVGGPGSRFSKLQGHGYAYQLLAPNVSTGVTNIVVASSGHELPGDAVTAVVPLPNSEWVLRVYPMDGWTPWWLWPFLTGITVMAVALSVLMFLVLVSRRQHQLLLSALLSKDMIRELRKEGAPTREVRILRAETPADMLLKMMSDLLKGYAPDLRDVVFIRTALTRNMDIYQPLNLSGHLRGASLDAEVEKALMRQLGSTQGIDSVISVGGDGTKSTERSTDGRDAGQYSVCETAAGMLQLIFSVQPYNVQAVGNTGDLLVRSHFGARDLESCSGMTSAGAASVGDGLERTSCSAGRWRARRTALFLSCNGRSSPSSPQPVVPSLVIEEAERLLSQSDSWQFNSWALQEATQGHALSALGFYLIQRSGILPRLRIKPLTLARLLRQIECGYLDNPYHNSVHAADVLQTLHVIIHATQLHVHYLDPLGLLAAYYAAIVHDYAHPGLTSDFLVATSDVLAVRYNDRSPLENHHCAASFGLLQQPELDALAPLSAVERAAFRKQVIDLVLATDMKQHFSILSHFNNVHRLSAYSQQQQQQQPQLQQLQQQQVQQSHPRHVQTPRSALLSQSVSMRASLAADKFGLPRPSPQQQPAPKPVDDTERLLSLQVALKCADIGHLGEALDVHQRWLGVLEEEFFRQGDKERDLGLPISPLFDRAKQGVSKSQVGFYDFVALPLAHALSSAFPGALPLMRCFLRNYNHWRAMDGQPPVELPRSKLVMPGPLRGVSGTPQLHLSASDRGLGFNVSLPRNVLGGSPLGKSKAQLSASDPLDGDLPMVKLTLMQE